MKPTQEQIEAALRLSDKLEKRGMADISDTIVILAAAYRAKCVECDELKKELRHIANLLDAHFDSGGTVAGLGTTNKARKLLNDKP